MLTFQGNDISLQGKDHAGSMSTIKDSGLLKLGVPFTDATPTRAASTRPSPRCSVGKARGTLTTATATSGHVLGL